MPPSASISFAFVGEQYQKLYEKYTSTDDPSQKTLLFRRLMNLLGVMQFLVTTTNLSLD